MIIHDCLQGSPEWMALRIGRPTASEFKKILTPAKAELSKQWRGYAFRLVAEILLNRSMDSLEGLEWVERGKMLEPEAVKMYEFSQAVKTRAVGFVTTDDGRIGASPDRLVIGQPRGVELKCPAPQTHVEYMVDGFGSDYWPQVQGQMFVAELDRVDLFSYHPEMPPFLGTICRDEPYIAKLAAALREFCDRKDEMLEQLRSSGFFAEREFMTPVDSAYDGSTHSAGSSSHYVIRGVEQDIAEDAARARTPEPRPATSDILGPGRAWPIISATGAEAQAPDGATWKGWWESEIARLIGRRSLIRLRLLVDSNAKLFEAIERQGRGEAAIVSEVRANCEAGIAALATGDQRGTR